MKTRRSIILWIVVSLLLALTACGKSISGTYKVVNGPIPGMTVTLGKDNFVFSSGASGTYEVNGDKVIFSSSTFSGVMKIDGDKLVNEKWIFMKQ